MSHLFLLNLGIGEILFILIMYLMFFGSKNIPSLARNLGSSIRKIKETSTNIRKDIKNSILDPED